MLKKNKFSELTSVEQTILEYLWEQSRWISGAEFWRMFNSNGKECKRQTVNTYLSRMVDKGLLMKQEQKYFYAYTKEEFDSERAANVLDTLYGGSAMQFIAALAGGDKLKKDEIEELKEYLDQLGQ